MRKRMTNSDWWTDADLIARLDPAGRLFERGLHGVAEDSGVFPYCPVTLKMKVYPGDVIEPAVIEGWLNTLAEIGRVVVFEVSGKKWGWLSTFHDEQVLQYPKMPVWPTPAWLIVDEVERGVRTCAAFSVDVAMLDRFKAGQPMLQPPLTA